MVIYFMIKKIHPSFIDIQTKYSQCQIIDIKIQNKFLYL